MYRTALLILSGTAGGAFLSLVRNLLIARLISVEDYGIAATFAMAMSMIEMLSAFGLQQQIVQSKNGSDPRFQAGLQGFHLARGLATGAILFFAAGAIANFLGIPEVAWAYQVTALVPVLNGLQHFDIHRAKRRMHHLPQTMAQILPNAVALLLIWPLVNWLPDYRLALAAMMAQSVLSLTVSHVMAERAYRISLDRSVISGALQFGWPLLINNILLFLVFQGEKLIVGRELGMTDLAILAMGFTLTLTPTLVIARTAQSFFLPQLSAKQSDKDQFIALSMITMQTVIAAVLVFLAGVVLVGRPLTILLLGVEYLPLVPLLIWLAIMQTVRALKTGGSTIALARGQTTNAMWANGVRLLTLPVAWLAAVNSAGLLTIIGIGIAGEMLGLVVSLVMLRGRLDIPLAPLVRPGLATAGVIAGASVVAWHAGDTPDQLWPTGLEVAVVVGLLGVALASLKHLWRYLRDREVTHFDQ